MIYRFNDCSLDVGSMELVRGGGLVAIEPLVFRLIVCLIENRDRVVTKDELIEKVWDGRVVSDSALNTCVNAARNALGDDGKTQAVIKTFPRRGFRFMADIVEDDPTSSASDPVSRTRRDVPSIAAPPFENMSGAPEAEYFSDGMFRWLEAIGLGRYARAFAENDIDFEVLPELTDADLKDLGLSLGHRRKLLKAIAGRGGAPAIDRHAQAPSSNQAERRQLTVLFCDLVGSTALASKLDPEDMRDVLRAYQDACAHVIAQYDGYVAKFMGDGVYAYFGYPRSHEDDAERAINAGLKIVEAVGALEHDLKVRMGVATGPVAVGDIIGEGASEEANVIGEAPNLAARLQELAEPGTVVIGEATHTLAGALFETRDLGARELKGFAEPVGAWAVIRPRRIESRFAAIRGEHLTDLVGRDEEIEILLRRWQQTKAGEGQVVLISGEPGIGKSRLARTLEERVAGEPHIRLRYQCSPYHTNSALHPFIEQLERAAGFETGDPADARLDKLEALMAKSGWRAASAAPLVAALLSVPAEGRYPPLAASGQRRRELTLQALMDRLSGLAERQPVLFVFEDAHWIDPTSLELLALTVERVAKLAVLVLITHRPEFDAPWTGGAHVTQMGLRRLRPRDCLAMVEQVAADAMVPEELRERIATQTDGIPMFVEELTKSVLESSRAGPDAPLIEVPATLQDSLEARLDRLGPAREIVQICSVIGREFRYELVAHVSGLAEDALRAALDRLVHAELVQQRGEPPAATYAFKHALVQETAYGSLLRGPRAQLHAQIAVALEERFPDLAEIEPETLAHHYTEAGFAEQAIAYWWRAGKFAADRSANAEAAAHFEKGLELIATLDESRERDERELDFWIDLTGALMAAKGYTAPDTERAHRRAFELCERIGETPKIFPVLYGRYAYIATSSQADKALEYAEDYLRLASSQSDDAQQMIGHRMLGMASLVIGRPGPARDHLSQAAAQYDVDAHGSLATIYGHDILAAALSQRGVAEWILGFPDSALASEQAALEHAIQIDHANSLGYTLGFGVLTVFGLIRDFATLRKHAQDILSLVDDYSLPFWSFYGRFRLAQSRFEEGEKAAGTESMNAALEVASNPRVFLWQNHATVLADALLRIGDKPAARHLLEDAESAAATDDERWSEPEIHRIRGDLAASDMRSREAEAHYRQALEIADSQDARSWELRAATRLAGLWRAEGKERDASGLLSPVYDWFTEGFGTPDVMEAKALLDAVS